MFSRQNTALTVVGVGATIEGNLEVENTIHVEGTVDGMIRAGGEVSIGKHGIVKGEVRAKNIKIAGRVEGAVICDGTLHMMSTGVIEGDAMYQSLHVESGGIINGSTGQIDPSVGATLEETSRGALPEEASNTRMIGQA